MSADQASSADKPDVPVPAADQGADGATTASAGRRHDAASREPATRPSRHEHADAMLAGPPVRSRETPGDSATADHQAGKAGRASPEHGAGPGHDDRTPARPQPPVRTRQDHADAMLAGTPSSPAVKRDLDRPGDQPSRPNGQATSGRPAGPGSEQAGTRGDYQGSTDGQAGARQRDPGEAGSPDRTRAGPAPSPGTERSPGASRPSAPEAEAGRNRGTSGDGKASAGATAHPDGKSTPASDGTPGHGDAGAAGRHRVHDGRQHGHQQAATGHDSRQPPARQDHGDAWPPPKADQDSARALYAQDFGTKATARDASGGRERGTNVVGDKPENSPGDTSDLPPTGEELLEMEGDDKKPRLEKFRDKFFDELEDINDATKEQGETLRSLMDRPPPAGHPEVAVNAGPMIRPEMPQHVTVDVGSAVELAMVAGVIGYQAGRWIEHKVEKLLRR
jgi:hypothetical protein